ncbi:MAG TPA: DUF397 domain-containing protein [Actinocrinis sp.]|uniref:DUF397 domain-containing protein n=1 Tax=Actinocrinis sp. TaxID=1920516 RepID=UPI002DDD608D|nr:DUF397 domain-containing protein [Actinocrinis sp.]HEV3174224.1 DUF397 domain-containing protein [Actinocrinis sp.]
MTAKHSDMYGKGEPSWRRSSRCPDGHCVEVSVQADVVLLRDSKCPERRAIPLAFAEWSVFMERMRNAVWGDSFDLATPTGPGL